VVFRIASRLLVPVMAVSAWQVLVSGNDRMSFVFGTPSVIMSQMWAMIATGELFLHISATLSAAIGGWAIGTISGTAMGIALSSSRRLFNYAEPYVLFIGSIPVFALGPLLIFWFGTGIMSKVVLVAIATFSISVLQSYNGAKNASSELLDMLRVYGATNHQLTWHVRIPSSISWVIAGLRINIGMALIGAVIGEFIASRVGLGHLIILGEGLYDMNTIWVGVLSVSFLAVVLNALISVIERRYSYFIQ